MQPFYNVLVKLTAFTIFFIIFYYYVPLKQFRTQQLQPTELHHGLSNSLASVLSKNEKVDPIHIWCILVKIDNSDSLLLRKLEILLESLLRHSKCRMSLNILTDSKSKAFVEKIIDQSVKEDNHFDEVVFHDIVNASAKISNITTVMQEHFSSVPGTYYSDSLFYLSLGLYKIAPSHHNKVILLDVDVKFQNSIEHLYEYFQKFGPKALFGLAPELSPVYHHILWKWKQANDNSSFGEPHTAGFPGVNSGVVLVQLNRIRHSESYSKYISEAYVTEITKKYLFKGHLGDQDFYTLLATEHPYLVHLLPCNWNRQLCDWWKHHGYADVFDQFARCDGPVYLYHGNCNTPIPVN